jgi:hypothetical protein
LGAVSEPLLAVQVVTLAKKNGALAQKCKENVSERTLLCKNVTTGEGVLRPVQVKEEVEADEVVIPDECTVRSIEPTTMTMVNWKYISAAVLALLAAAVVFQLLRANLMMTTAVNDC